ncbi:MAG TPA: hypothetical protein DER09_02140 [Prolixibacteraceae bacterium]|nr:hypothetical protein [Prolixibacteraceae bacterium]
MSIAVYPFEDFKDLPEYTIRIVIGKPQNHNSLHTGIIFKHEGRTHFFHLAWHHILTMEVSPDVSDYDKILFLDFPFFDINDETFHRRKAIIPYFILVHELNADSIPYAILYNSTKFLESGKLDIGEGEFGLTCATFVLAIFRSKGINLLDTGTWFNRIEDKEFFNTIYYILKDKIKPEHESHLISNKNCVRFRPEEVSASSTIFNGKSVSFVQAAPLGVDLKSILFNK